MTKDTPIDKDDLPIKFGKYKGKTPNEVSQFDPKYIIWYYDSAPNRCSEQLYTMCVDLMEDLNPTGG